MAKKTYDRQKAKIWGSPDYMMMRYADVETVKELSRNAKAVRAAKALVGEITSPLNRLSVHKVYETTGRNAEGPVTQTVVHVSFGLNGGGDQVNYLDALKRLVGTDRFRIFDAYVDAVDDLADVLCVFLPAISKVAKAPQDSEVK